MPVQHPECSYCQHEIPAPPPGPPPASDFFVTYYFGGGSRWHPRTDQVGLGIELLKTAPWVTDLHAWYATGYSRATSETQEKDKYPVVPVTNPRTYYQNTPNNAPQAGWMYRGDGMWAAMDWAVANNKRIHLACNFKLGANGSLLIKNHTNGRMQPHVDLRPQIKTLELADEPSWTANALTNVTRWARKTFPGRRIGSVYQRERLEQGRPPIPDAEILAQDWLGIELYIPGPDDAGDAANRQNLARYFDRVLQRVAGKHRRKLVAVFQGYNRNGTWSDLETLAALQYSTYDVIKPYLGDEVIGISYFAWGRTLGNTLATNALPAVFQAHQDIFGDLRGRGLV